MSLLLKYNTVNSVLNLNIEDSNEVKHIPNKAMLLLSGHYLDHSFPLKNQSSLQTLKNTVVIIMIVVASNIVNDVCITFSACILHDTRL